MKIIQHDTIANTERVVSLEDVFNWTGISEKVFQSDELARSQLIEMKEGKRESVRVLFFEYRLITLNTKLG